MARFNADWLLEQCHKIWLAVGNAGSWKRLFLAWLFLWMIRRRRREGSILLSFLLFYGLMVGNYALICAMEIQKIHMVVHIFSGFALFTESECIAELNPSASCWPLTRCLLIYQQTGVNQNTVNLRSGSIFVSLCNNISAGKAKRKQSLIQTFYETSAAHFFDWLTFTESANQNYFCYLFL